MDPAPLTVTGIMASNKQYNANISATLNTAGATLVGTQGSDSLTLNTAGATGTFASPNVASGITVQVSGLTVSGAAWTAGDYTLTQPTTMANITAAPLTVSGITAADKTYDSTTTASLDTASAVLVGVQGSDSLTLDTTGATGTFASPNVANGIPVTVAGLTITGSAWTAGDYTLTQPTTTANITTAPLTITASPQSKTYGIALDPNTTAFTTVGLVGSDSVAGVTLASPGAAATAAVAGSPYTITASEATGTGLGNYTITYDSAR